VLVFVQVMHESGRFVEPADADVAGGQDVAQLVADQIDDVLEVQLRRDALLDAVDDGELGVALLGFLQQALRLGEEAGIVDREHRLRREIIATVVANQRVDRGGTTLAFRLGEETGASPSSLARAFAVAREVFGMRSFWEDVEALDNKVDAELQLRMLLEGRRLVERSARWLVLENPGGIQIEAQVRRFEPGAELLRTAIPDILEEEERTEFGAQVDELTGAGVHRELATCVAALPSLTPVFDIVAVAALTGRELDDVMHTYFRLGYRLALVCDHRLCSSHPDPWRLSRLRVDAEASLPRFRAILSGAHSGVFRLADIGHQNRCISLCVYREVVDLAYDWHLTVGINVVVFGANANVARRKNQV